MNNCRPLKTGKIVLIPCEIFFTRLETDTRATVADDFATVLDRKTKYSDLEEAAKGRQKIHLFSYSVNSVFKINDKLCSFGA